jgi:hypothetical protein
MAEVKQGIAGLASPSRPRAEAGVGAADRRSPAIASAQSARAGGDRARSAEGGETLSWSLSSLGRRRPLRDKAGVARGLFTPRW